MAMDREGGLDHSQGKEEEEEVELIFLPGPAQGLPRVLWILLTDSMVKASPSRFHEPGKGCRSRSRRSVCWMQPFRPEADMDPAGVLAPHPRFLGFLRRK